MSKSQAQFLGSILTCAALLVVACRPSPPPRPLRGFDQWPAARAEVMKRRHGEAGPEPRCDIHPRIRRVLPDPLHVPDKVGEWVELANDGPEVVSLNGWRLVSGERSQPLRGSIIKAGGGLCVRGSGSRGGLGPVRLRNGEGSVALVGPCGIERSRLRWGQTRDERVHGGEILRNYAPWEGGGSGPAPVEGGAAGGCGQS